MAIVLKPKIKKVLSVKWKIFNSLLLFVCIIIIVLWLFQVFFLEKFYIAIKSKSVKSAAEEINEVIHQKDYKKQIDNIAKQGEFCVVIYNDSGSNLYNTQGDPRCRISALSYQDHSDVIGELKAEAYMNGKSASRLIEENYGKIKEPISIILNGNRYEELYPKSFELQKNYEKSFQNMMYMSVVKDNYNSFLTIAVSAQLTPVNATVETIKTQFIMIAALLVLIAITLAFFLSKKIATPIIRINKSAKNLGNGDYGTNFNEKGYLEIQELSNTLNYAATELSKVEGLRRELIANMSHDLRTPLTMISGYGEVMRDIPGENTPENVQIVIDETKRLTNLVNDMLDLSKLQAGVQELQLQKINLSDEIRTIIKRYDKLLSGHEVVIDFNYVNDVYIEGDIIKLNQVLYNLMNNAINYCGSDNKIIVSQKVENQKVRIEIIDHGRGIEKELLPYIWDRYYKVDKTHIRSKVGSGLGLSIVKAILVLHKAEYGVQSEVNKGTTFWFQLPIVQVKEKTS